QNFCGAVKRSAAQTPTPVTTLTNRSKTNLKFRFMKTKGASLTVNPPANAILGGRILIDGGTRITRLLQGAGGSAIELFGFVTGARKRKEFEMIRTGDIEYLCTTTPALNAHP